MDALGPVVDGKDRTSKYRNDKIREPGPIGTRHVDRRHIPGYQVSGYLTYVSDLQLGWGGAQNSV